MLIEGLPWAVQKYKMENCANKIVQIVKKIFACSEAMPRKSFVDASSQG